MSHFLVKRKPDANHVAIVDALLKHGVDVIDLAAAGAGICDLATNYKNRVTFIEIKCGKTAKLKKTQVRFLAHWSGYAGIARSEDEAIALATDPISHGLTDAQKGALGEFYATMQTKEVRLATITKILEAVNG